MKKFLFVFFLIVLSCFFASCFFENNDLSSNTNSGTNTPKISSEYWGTWIQMDTGAEYYIDNQNIYKKYSSSKSKIQSGIDGYYLESDKVLRSGNTVFFRKGGKNRSFSVTVSGFSTNRSIRNSSRAAGTGNQGVSGRRENKENSEDSETVDSEDDNSLDFDGGVADDPQTVTVTDGEDTGTATVVPQYDGENVGSIPVVEPGKYAFKTTYKIENADSQGFMYGNDLGIYNISFNLTNIGQATCETSVYSISWNDSNLSSSDLVKEGNFTSIGPGSAKVISGNFTYGYFDEEYKDVTITISITDSKYGETWNDYVTLRFYRGWVSYKVNARNFNQSSTATLKGFLVYPDGRSKRFTVSSEKTTTISVPWSTKDYYFVLSGANNDTEMCYSFIPAEYGSPADLSGLWSITDINAYEPNDRLQNAVYLTDYKNPIKAYLKNGDIDYYKFNTSSLKCNKGLLEYSGHQYSDSTSISSTYNNADGNINSGELIWMDIEIHNSSAINRQNLVVEVTSPSEYISFTANSANYGSISGGYYQSYYGSTDYYYRGTGWGSSSTDYYSVTSSSYVPFKFKISEECPVGTTIPINMKITDKNGYEWNDSFNLTVSKSGTDMEYSGHQYSDSTSISSTYNNKDGNINPGELIWMDIEIHNKGTSQAKAISVEVTSPSEYISFTANSAIYGDVTAGYYQSYYGSTDYYQGTGWGSSSYDYYSVTSSSYVPVKFKISEECPVETTIPINMKITDKNGYEWTDSFNITIVAEDVNLAYSTHSLSSFDGTVMHIGDSRTISVTIKNEGISLARGVTATISSEYPHIQFAANEISYGDISGGKTKTSNTSFRFEAIAEFVTSTVIPMKITITDSKGNVFTETFNINKGI